MKLIEKTGKEPSQTTLADPRNPRRLIGIEELLRWTYQDQYAHTITVDDDFYISNKLGFGNGRSGFDELAALGCLVQSSGYSLFDIDPDAEAVHEQVMRLDVIARGLVIMHGVAGTRPDCMAGAIPKPVRVRRGNGKPKLEYFDTARTRPAYCLVCYSPEPDHLRFVRQVYTQWWDALTVLEDALADLQSYQIKGFSLAREPWLDRPEKL